MYIYRMKIYLLSVTKNDFKFPREKEVIGYCKSLSEASKLKDYLIDIEERDYGPNAIYEIEQIINVSYDEWKYWHENEEPL